MCKDGVKRVRMNRTVLSVCKDEQAGVKLV